MQRVTLLQFNTNDCVMYVSVCLVENTVYIDKQVQTNTEFAENGAAESAFISSSLLL